MLFSRIKTLSEKETEMCLIH